MVAADILVFKLINIHRFDASIHTHENVFTPLGHMNTGSFISDFKFLMGWLILQVRRRRMLA